MHKHVIRASQHSSNRIRWRRNMHLQGNKRKEKLAKNQNNKIVKPCAIQCSLSLPLLYTCTQLSWSQSCPYPLRTEVKFPIAHLFSLATGPLFFNCQEGDCSLNFLLQITFTCCSHPSLSGSQFVVLDLFQVLHDVLQIILTLNISNISPFPLPHPVNYLSHWVPGSWSLSPST